MTKVRIPRLNAYKEVAIAQYFTLLKPEREYLLSRVLGATLGVSKSPASHHLSRRTPGAFEQGVGSLRLRDD
jgi:hypothetical protein